MTYTLGVDIGTYQTKGVLVDPDGRVVAQAARDHEMIVPRPGWAEHRAEADWWADFVHVTGAVLAEASASGAQVAAVAVSGIGPCMLPVDADGAPLTNAVLYGVDTRAHEEVADLTARIGEGTLLDRCGNALTSQSVGPKIEWLRRTHPDVHAEAAHFTGSAGYLVQRLTGAVVVDHYTAANYAPLYDIAARDWAFDLAPEICDPATLPKLMWTGEIAGEITRAAANATGLAPGTPVTTGTIDAAAEALSVGLSDVGDTMIMYGSTIFVIQRTATRIRDARLWTAPWLFEGEHAAMAGLATSGTLTHWFRDRFARELVKDDAFASLTAEAARTPPGAGGLLFLPYFSGERTPIHDPAARGAWFGLNLTHGRGHMYRALLEGIAQSTAHVTDTYAEAGAAPGRLLAVGGGTRNDLWMQATSDLTALPQVVRANTVGASYGNAFLARLALGGVARGDIATWNPTEREIAPRNIPAYDALKPLYRRLYDATKDIAHALPD
ncbi:MAG: FGGY-family carbohydrate kinase [Paracoccaceae bacterium]